MAKTNAMTELTVNNRFWDDETNTILAYNDIEETGSEMEHILYTTGDNEYFIYSVNTEFDETDDDFITEVFLEDSMIKAIKRIR